MRILLFGHTYQPSRSEQIRHVLQTLSRTEAELVAHGDFYDFLSKEFPDVCHRIGEIDCRSDYTADMALSIGGDGTFLRAAEKIGDRGIPVWGVNIGRLGFFSRCPCRRSRTGIERNFRGKV